MPVLRLGDVQDTRIPKFLVPTVDGLTGSHLSDTLTCVYEEYSTMKKMPSPVFTNPKSGRYLKMFPDRGGIPS